VTVNGTLDLSTWTAFQNDAGEDVNCFDKIKELMKKQAENTSLTDAEKEAQTKALADEIAQKLCAESYAQMSGITENYDHFDRALQDGKYSIIVYDYRDEQQLTTLNASDAIVNKSCVADVTIPYSYLEPGTTAQVNSKLYIVCSSQSIYGDRVPLELPLISADTLGITGYDVARYSEKTTYSDAYKARLEAWDNDVSLQTVNVPEQTVEVPSFKKKMTFVNGEVKIQYEPTSTYKTIPAHSYELRVHNSPKPVPGDDDLIRTVSYDPDSNRQIRDALDYVLMCRATLGAQQNRLEHSYNNNQNKYENMSSAESVIRDTDIAKEMVDFSNNNILEQAGVSVLSQANQSAQMMLQLLQ
jgi:flagellin-like hook-associated protein FlgL